MKESIMKIVAIQICSLYTGVKIMKDAMLYSRNIVARHSPLLSTPLLFIYWFSFAIASFNIVLMIRKMQCKLASRIAMSSYMMIQVAIMVTFYTHAHYSAIDVAKITGSRGILLVHCVTLLVLAVNVALNSLRKNDIVESI